MVDQNTAKYLNDNIGAVLSKALSEMSVQQPNDGVEFLSQWLNTYADNEEAKLVREQEEKQMEQDRSVTQKREGEKAARREKLAADKKAISDSYQKMLEKLSDESQIFQESFWSELVDVAKQHMGAQSVYLGVLDEEGLDDVEPPLIRYSHENIFAGSPSLLDKILPKVNIRDPEVGTLSYGALAESVPEEEQGAKCLWKPAPPPQPPVPEGEEPPPPPEGPKYLPVSVPCVTDVPSMHYFEMPRLGAYFASPLVYNTYYTQQAFGEAKTFEEAKAEKARIKAEKDAEKQAQIEEAREKGLEEPEFPEEEAEPEPEMVLTGTNTKLVLCMDTLGTNTLFDQAKFGEMMALCDTFAACKARSEIKEVDDQAIFAIDKERRTAAEDLETGVPMHKEDAKTALQSKQDEALKEINDRGLEPDPKKAVEEICYKKFAHLQAKEVVKAYVEHIKLWARTCVTVQPEVLNTLAALCFLVGYTKADVYSPRKQKIEMIKWWKFKSLILDDTAEPDAFFNKMEASNVDIGRKGLDAEQKLSFIKGLLPADFTEEKAKEVDTTFEVLWNFVSSAVDYRLSALKQAQVEFDERKKAAEEAGEEFTEEPLDKLDDDFEGLAA
jgi:hypothetical protein